MSVRHPLRVTDYLQHILEAISQIQIYTNGMQADEFHADRKTSDAVIRNLEVIGEACNNITKNHPDFTAQHASVPWAFAYEMRNALAHGYFTVDLGVVWQTIQNDLPVLQMQVAKLRD